MPRIAVPRAKGDRGDRQGRWVFLGPHAVQLIRQIPRSDGSRHLLVPGRQPGRPLYRLNEAWAWVLAQAGLPPAPVKVLRHCFSTYAVEAGIPSEHRQQLLGHRGAPITDTVYLKRHGPALAQAAARVEAYLRGLLGDLETGTASPPAEIASAQSGSWREAQA